MQSRRGRLNDSAPQVRPVSANLEKSETGSNGLRLPSYIPELDGLRGIAIAAVLVYHCHPKLHHFGIDAFAQWGWLGVNLFFVLSGFLITGIIADSRGDSRFFRNFYARRALRIWPVYVLLLLLNYVIVPFVFTGNPWWSWHEIKSAPWLHYVFFVQNLFFLDLPGTIGPTWSLAIEEQFYVVWAPVARFFRNTRLVPLLISVIVASPIIRIIAAGRLTPTHTLIHLDGLAIGSLIAVALRTFDWDRSTWRRIGNAALVCGGFGAVLMLFRGTGFTDTLLALGFGGMLISGFLANSAPNLYGSFLKSGPLKFLGTISYGLYMIHILVFVSIGAFDVKMERFGTAGDFAVVAVRLTLSIAVATLMWHGFEKPILRLKRYFVRNDSPAKLEAPAPALAAATADLAD